MILVGNLAKCTVVFNVLKWMNYNKVRICDITPAEQAKIQAKIDEEKKALAEKKAAEKKAAEDKKATDEPAKQPEGAANK